MSARRVALGLSANVFGNLVIAGVQLVLVPVFAIYWGLELYAAWVLLAAIPSFLSLSDFGFGTAAGTRMTMLVSRGEYAQAVRTFQSGWAVTLIVSPVMALMAITAVWLVPDHVLPHAASLSVHNARLTLVLLLVYGIISLQGSILTSGFRCSGLFALGTMWGALTILIENVAAIALVVAGGQTTVVALALLLCRSAALVGQAIVLRARVPWLRLGLSEATRDEARSLLSPAIAVMMMPLAQASFLQGTALALGIAASETVVPAFTAARTVSRIGLQIPSLLNHALMPEYSAAVARDDRRGQATMLALTMVVGAVTLVPFALLLAVVGPEFIRLWTHGVIHASRGLMIVMATTVILGGIWNPLSNLILATNRHASFSYPYVFLAVMTMPVAYLLARWWAATGAALAIVLLDAGMCAVILKLCRDMFVTRRELMAAAGGLIARMRGFAASRRWR